MEGSMKNKDGQKQLVVVCEGAGEVEAKRTKTDAQKQLHLSEEAKGEMQSSMAEKDMEKQQLKDSEKSQGEMEASMIEKDTQKQLNPERSQGDIEKLEEENKKLKESLIQQEKVMSEHHEENKKLKESLIHQEKCMEMKEKSWKVKLSELRLSMELKEGSWMTERSELIEKFVMQHNERERSMEETKEGWKMELKSLQDELEKQLNERERSMEQTKEGWKMELKSLQDVLEKQLNEQKLKEETWEKERSKFQEKYQKLFQENSTNVERLSAYQQLDNRDKLIAGSPLDRFQGKLPLWMSPSVAPKGYISGEELGVFMNNLIPITAIVVTYANKDTDIVFPVALVTFGATVVGSMFNNMVTSISMDPEARLWPALKKSVKQVPWMVAGAVVPLIVGVIPDWKIRCGVATAATLAVKLTAVGVWKASYKIKGITAASIVAFGILGTGLAAGLPQLIALIVKK